MKIVALGDLPEEGVSHDPQLLKRVMIRNGEVPHIKQFACLRMDAGDVAHAHAHAAEYEIVYVEAGEGVIRLNGRTARIGVGMCIVFEPRETHEIANPGPAELVLLYVQVMA